MFNTQTCNLHFLPQEAVTHVVTTVACSHSHDGWEPYYTSRNNTFYHKPLLLCTSEVVTTSLTRRPEQNFQVFESLNPVLRYDISLSIHSQQLPRYEYGKPPNPEPLNPKPLNPQPRKPVKDKGSVAPTRKAEADTEA